MKTRLLLGVLLVLGLILLSGCSKCRTIQTKYYVEVPENVTTYEEVVNRTEYNVSIEQGVQRLCNLKTDYEVRYDDSEWFFEREISYNFEDNNYNQVRRTFYIKNNEDFPVQFVFNVKHLVDGVDMLNATNPSRHWVAANEERDWLLAWTTDYDPAKDVEIEVIKTLTERNRVVSEICENVPIIVNKTEYKEEKTLVPITGTAVKTVIKYQPKRVCT